MDKQNLVWLEYITPDGVSRKEISVIDALDYIAENNIRFYRMIDQNTDNLIVEVDGYAKAIEESNNRMLDALVGVDHRHQPKYFFAPKYEYTMILGKSREITNPNIAYEEWLYSITAFGNMCMNFNPTVVANALKTIETRNQPDAEGFFFRKKYERRWGKLQTDDIPF